MPKKYLYTFEQAKRELCGTITQASDGNTAQHAFDEARERLLGWLETGAVNPSHQYDLELVIEQETAILAKIRGEEMNVRR